MSKICFGCGIKLQSDDEEKEGYVPEEKLASSAYCKRCFRLMHYGENVATSTPKSTEAIIKTVNKNAHRVVFMTDFINVFDEVMHIFDQIKVPKILVISKSDIIPKNISFSQIRAYLKAVYKVRDDIIFTSNRNNLNTLLKKLHGCDEVYFLGLTNAGKSTLLNALIEKFDGKTKKLTTSYKRNTTQNFVRIELGNMTLIDSPGFVIDNFELNKFTNIDDEIKPITFQEKVDTTYRVDDLFDISIVGVSNVVFYFSKHISITRLYEQKVKGVTFKVAGNSDIVICGLGFIKVTADVSVTVSDEMMKYIRIRPSIVGGIYE